MRLSGKRRVLSAVALHVLMVLAPNSVLSADQGTGMAAYEEGRYLDAFDIWEPPARSGDPVAQYNIGRLYQLGQGVFQDFEVAAQLYEMSADQGYPYAQHNLAMLYESGKGVDQSFSKAYRWFRRAAKQGNRKSMYRLGIMYQEGEGVGKSQDLAYFFIYMASSLDLDGLEQRLSSLVKSISGTRVNQIQQSASQWKPGDNLPGPRS